MTQINFKTHFSPFIGLSTYMGAHLELWHFFIAPKTPQKWGYGIVLRNPKTSKTHKNTTSDDVDTFYDLSLPSPPNYLST